MTRSLSVLVFLTLVAATQLPRAGSAQGSAAQDAPRARAWFERYTVRGYAQIRYNRLLETNARLTCGACDRSIGNNNGFSFRRARLVLAGEPGDRTAITVELDYSSEIAGQAHVLQLRTAIFDLFLDAGRVHRLRLGQAKLPFGFETLQSSSQRLPLDRSDAINAGVPNERDLGVFYLWSPPAARARFRILTDSGLKGSGDYGVLQVGVHNGQTANRPELNNSLHRVARLAWPFRFANGQFLELGVQGYAGRFVVPSAQRSAGVAGPLEFADRRAAATLVFFPQPLGIQAEWNTGRGPAFDSTTRTIREDDARGGYVQAMYRIRSGRQTVTPFVRYQRYDGGRKTDLDARRYRVRETELGVEWLPLPGFELTAQYTSSDRLQSDGTASANRQKGRLLRLQAQVNY
jgi:hypothetical protein